MGIQFYWCKYTHPCLVFISARYTNPYFIPSFLYLNGCGLSCPVKFFISIRNFIGRCFPGWIEITVATRVFPFWCGQFFIIYPNSSSISIPFTYGRNTCTAAVGTNGCFKTYPCMVFVFAEYKLVVIYMVSFARSDFFTGSMSASKRKTAPVTIRLFF